MPTSHPWFYWIAVVVGLLTGCLLGAQPSVNGFLGRQTAHPLQASTISFVSGTLLLVVVTLALGVFPPKLKVPVGELPWWAWTGGAIGTVMVTASLFFVPRVGALAWFAVVMTGQIVAAIALDHFGWLGTPKQPPSLLRYLGALFLILGIVCISGAKRSKSLQPSEAAEAASPGISDEQKSSPER